MADKTLGQVAYEKYTLLFRGGRGSPGKVGWANLRGLVQERWEAVAAAVVEEYGGRDG